MPFSIRQGIVHNRWTAVVHLPEGKTVEKPVQGSRRSAETVACTVIDKWLEKHPSQ
jgi:hypothetical protein